jgi:hypothetical protein
VESLFKNPKIFKHGAEMHLNHGELAPVLDWCHAHLKGEWGWMDHTDLEKSYNNNWIFLFDDDDDFSYFVLRWK